MKMAAVPGRRLAWALTLAGAMSAPAVAIAQHAPAPQQHETKPQPAAHVTKPATPAAPKPAATKTDRGAFSNLQAAIARIQKRVTATMGAGASPQTVATILPKPKVATPSPKPGEAPVKPAEPAAKPAESAAKPAGAAAVTDDRALKPAIPAVTDSTAAATQRQPAAAKAGPRIALTWRTGLAWPRELLSPDGASEPISKDATPASPSGKRITLIWR